MHILAPLLSIIALTTPVLSGWIILESMTFSAKDRNQLSSMTAAYVSAIESYYATLTTAPAYSRAVEVFDEFQRTGISIPAALTASNTVVTYTSTPAWYTALPTEAKDVFDDMDKKNHEIQASIQADANRANGGARLLPVGMWLSGGLVVMVVGVVAAL